MGNTPADPDADARLLALFDKVSPLSPAGAAAPAWLARDADTGINLYVKRLKSDAGKARLTAALQLTHPNLVRTRRWMTVGGSLYVVRDVIRGRNLKQELQATGYRQTPELLTKLLNPVLSALEAAHARGVPHGGVSAENILIADDGRVLVSDLAVSDPASPDHRPFYNGAASVEGDIRAMRALVAQFLPTGGAFAQPAVRARVAGIVGACDSLGDLRETLLALDRLASAPVPRSEPPVILPPFAAVPEWVGPPPLPEEKPAEAAAPVVAGATVPDTRPTQPGLAWETTENPVRVVRGGGAPATLVLTNEGDTPASVIMVATQHGWLNVRPLELPISLPPGAQARVEFTVSAARLSPGEYRSEVYFKANSGGRGAEDLRGGWFKHRAEVRVLVVADAVDIEAGRANGGLPYPANAPRIPAPAGCGLLFFCAGAGVLSAAALSVRLLWGAG